SRKGLYSANHRFGGFYREVELEWTPNVRLDDVWVRGDFDKRSAQVEFLVRSSEKKTSQASKPMSVNLVVKTPDGKTAGKASRSGLVPVSDSTASTTAVKATLQCAIDQCRFWSPEEPNLYIAQLELLDENGKAIHGQVERFGVRKLEVVGREFYLNGKPYFLRGGGDHNYDCNFIIEQPNRARFLEHMKIYKAAGFNFMRHHTHCPLPEYFEAADEAGILLMPELPYYHDVPTEAFDFDPIRDARELFLNYRRYVSFAVYSGGNEGHLGSPVDEKLYQWVKKNDPQRLVLHQDGGRNLATNSDFSNGPIRPWTTCKEDELDRPFVAHEYLNLAIKMDPRLESRFTGARVSPVSMKKYHALLQQTGLNESWGAACIAAAEKLQAIYQKQGLESARLDPACDGYSFWSIVDASIPQGETVAAQGYLNPFWEPRPNGLTPSEFFKFNGPTALLLKTVPEEPIASSGDTIQVDFRISHYGANEIPAGTLTWKLAAGNDIVASGTVPVKAVKVGYAGSIAQVPIIVPELKKPKQVKLVVELSGVKCPNDWDFWLFPKRERPSLSGVVVSPSLLGWFQKRYDHVTVFGDPKMKATDAVIASMNDDVLRQAIDQGRKILVLSPASPRANVSLGWWGIGTQVGTAFADHPVFGSFPKSAAMDQLWFKLIRAGAPDLRQEEQKINKEKQQALPARLTVADIVHRLQPLAVGEGRDSYYLYLGQGKLGSASVVATFAIDLLQDRPEALGLLDSLVDYIKSDKFIF
ncbi:MAG: hypothetical protein Q4G59_08765, partial [Planctomycetia bacterium]|nr:hypothetical protein [Planctomycetia bacterium]